MKHRTKQPAIELGWRADETGVIVEPLPAAGHSVRRRASAGAVALALTAGGIVAGGFVTSAPVAATSAEVAGDVLGPRPGATTQQNVFIFTNAHRQRAGAEPVRYDPALTIAAQRHAEDMASGNVLSNIGSDGSNADQRIASAGFASTSWGENLAVGFTSSSDVVWAWLSSSGDRANLLDPRFQRMGVGIAYGHGKTWWSVVLATSAPAAAVQPAGAAAPASPAPAPAPASTPATAVLSHSSSSNSSNNSSSNSSNNSSSNSSNNSSSNSSNNSSSNSSNNSSSNSSNNSSSNSSSNSNSNN